MSKKTRSDRSQKSPFSNPTVVAALITGIVGLIVALITALPQLVPLFSRPTETPVPTLTATFQPISPPTATEMGVTGMATEIPPTPTETLTPTPTPMTTLLSCLNRWEVISDLTATPESQAGCEKYGYPDLGIEPLQNGALSFGKTALLIDAITGITTNLSNEASKVSFDVELNELTDSEFWIALSNDKNPEVDSINIRLQSNGLVRIYDVNGNLYTDKTWGELKGDAPDGSGKYNYKFVFEITGRSVNFFINELPLTLPTNPNYLFFGFKHKSTVKPVTVYVNISNLEVK
jgi:hypothetical protein